ncbi:MAG: DUF86 domain-containing protein [Armatimonadetes bacterium]|nr:DUF86 domain-containing protein [Armatimonadota bacterium]
MPARDRSYLFDIREALNSIRAFIAGVDHDSFVVNDMLLSAVIRNLEIIGEASRVLPDEIKARANEVEWRKIIALRNLLLHEYFGVSLPIVWDIARNKLEALDATCARLLGVKRS